MYKSKRQKNKSFDWYGLSQRFSIRKYHFGAASVLLGTALILGAAQTTAKAEEATTENKTEAVTSAPKDDKASENVTNVTTPALSATTGAAVVEKPALSDEEVAKLAAEASKKDEKASEAATTEKTEAADKEKVILTPATDKKADKKDEKKAENPITATKTVLEQLTSEAEVLNTTASNFADKKAEDKAGKEAIAAAVASAKVQIEASKKALAAGEITKEELDAQLQRISSAIEAVYAEMKRGGHIGKVEAVLAGDNTANAGGRDSAPQELTPVVNAEDLTDSEVAAIIKQIRTSNPGLTYEDVITVNKTRGSQAAGFTTITYADGSGSVTFEPGQVMVASAGIKNLEQLSSSINWFNFASATITYKDGTVASPVRYYENTTATPDGRLYKQLDANTGTTGRTLEGYFSMYRDVTLGRDYTVDGVLYAKGTKLKSTDDAFLKMGIAKYEQHIYYSGGKQGETNVKIPNASNPTTYTTKKLGEIYEVLQVGMKFDVPTRVEGYRLNATVTKLAPKEVATDPQKGQGNRLRYYTNGVNGKNTTDTTAVYDIVDAPDGGGRGVDVLLTTQDKTNSYLRKAGIETTYRERREGDSETNPTGTKREGLTAFSSSRDHSNFGVSLYLQATYNGQLVPVNAVVADADESGLREYSQFETDGGAWEKLMEVHWDNRRLDNNGDAIVDGNGTSILVDKNGKAYVDNAGNPMFINKYWKTTREDVVTNGINEAKYYLTTASGAKVLVSEKDNLPILDAEGNPTILDSTGTRMTTTKDGMFQNGYIGKDDNNQNVFKIGSTNGIKVRQVLDAEGRPILRGGSIPGLAAFILPRGVKTTSLEVVNGKKKLFDTTDGKHDEITRDFYGNSILWTDGSVDGRVSATDTLKFTNPNKKPIKLTTASDIGDFKDAGYDPSEWVSPSAYGNKTFGSFSTAVGDGYRLPIGLTEGVSNLSFYGNSTSSVSGFIGFVVTDGGDAPKSYGSAKHIIGNFNKVENNQEVTATQPYIGDQPGDPDFRSTVNEKSGDWVLDDLVMTNKYVEKDLGAGETDPSKQVKVTNQKGDTGTFIVTDSGNAVIRREDGTQVAINQGDVLTTPDPQTGLPMIGIYNSTTKKLGVGAIPDEGEAQLLDPDAVDNTGKKIKGEYTLRQASDTEYVLYGVKANPGVNNKEAYLRGWVDFNGNGKFDVDEASELIKVTPGQKTYDVKFKNIAQLLDTSIDKAGVRLRIALEEQDIRESTGLAGSGEVEDFQTFVTHSPRGTRHETKDYQGQEQNIKIPTNAMFIANGKSKDSGYKNWAQINNVELSPKIVLTDKIVDTTKVTTLDPNAEKDKTDLGTKGLVSRLRKNPDGSIYTKDGNVFIDKNDATVLSGKLVQVKDKNNKVLGTALEVVNPNNNKTEYLMSEYNEYDNAGNKVGTYKINPANAGDNKELTGGFYETAVTFKPEIGFVGKAKGIAIRAWDDNNNSTGWEASTQTIAASAASTTLADKDKINGNVNNGVNNYKSMDTTYIPTVIDIKPVGKDETTIDEQGKKQSATPRIPDHGTVESINNEHIDEAKIDKAHVLIDKSKPIKFATTESIPAKTYTEDTKVTEETVVTYEDGGTETFKPVDKIPAGAVVFDKNQPYTVTGTGNITVNKVNYGGGSVPKGAILTGSEPTAPVPVTVLRDGNEVIVQAGEKLKKGDQLVTPLPVHGGAQRTEWTITYQKGETIPGKRTTTNITLENEITVDQLLGKKGDSITFDGKTYTNNNDTIPKGTKTRGTEKDLLTKKLPKATHVNPTTGEVTTVERRYTKVTDTEIVIENEGTYTLVPKTKTNEKGETVYEDAEIVFTPHPSFVGVGTGVTIKQPDVDYDNPVATDSVRSRYGTDYGYAKYTPTVTPNLTATITRKIHYVYEGDASVPPQDKTPILTIDGKPVTNEQTLTYNRDYIVMSQDGQTEKDITVATEMTLESPITVDRYVRKATGEVVKEATQVTQLKPGDVVKAGTQLPAGTVIVGAWKAINPENDHFTDIISPTLKGYTAEVQLPETEYTKSEKNGVQSHVRSSNQTPVGVYTPTIKDGKANTQDVGSYEPMVSAVRADNKDDFDVYVYYKADKQVARVVYIDMDAASNADQGVLETHTGSTLEANKSATDTITKDETLYGDSATRIKYSTAATIAKYEAMGYELKRDGFTNDDDGNRIVGGRKFDEESVADSANAGEKAQNQTFYVFLGHKRDTGAKTERADVTRTINYKYKKDGSKAAESVTETLNFTRNITIDMALAAAAFPEDTATFNSENTKATPEEKQAAQAKYAEVEQQYNAAAEKVKEDSTTAQALATADKDVTTTEKALADAKKVNNSLVITSESKQAQKDAKAAAEATLQAAQTAYDNALAARDTARTNYLAAANSDLAKAVITTQKALEAENAKVAAAKAEYESKVKDNNASDADKNAALTKFTDALAIAKTAAANATAAQKAFTDAKDEKEALNDAKVAEAVKNKAIQDRDNTTKAAKEAARQAYYDAVIAKVKEESKKETPDKNKVAAVSFGEWKALGSKATNLPANEQLSEAEKQSDNAFNNVTSPTITGYLADKVAIDKTDAIDPLADDYEVDVFYEQGEQRATVKFVEVDADNPDTVITPGVAEDLVEIGKTGDNFATLNTAAVKAAIKKLEDKGYTLVSDGFENPGTGVSNTTFDSDPKKDQEFVVKVKAKVVDIPSFDPTKPASNDNPKPTPGVTPIDPNNPTGPKWTEDLIKAVNVQEEVTRTIKYVYEDGSEVPADKLADVADKKVKTVKFTRPGKINVATGEITYGDWSADQTFEAVTSPTIENYTAVVAGVTPATDTVPTKTVAATDKDFEEVVVYKKAKPVTITPDAKVPDPEDPNTPADNPIQPNKPIDPNNPEGPKWTKELIDKLRAAREETVTRTITYKYSTETSELKAEDAAKAGQTAADTVTNSVTFKRPVTIDPVTKEFTYGDWVADNNDTTLEGKADLPVVAGYVATGDVEASKKDVTDVKATDKDITDKVVYKALGKFVPVVPEGFTPPTIENPQYPNNNDDPSKPGDPTTTTTIPYVPGTTPVGPDGQPLKPKVEGDPKQGYVPPAPTTPTGDTTIVYVKDGSQVAVVHFVDEKGNSVNESVIETGDTGGTISTTKADAVKTALEAKGYEVVAPTDALYTADKEGFYKEADRKFDAVSDKATGAAGEKVPSQQYYVIVKAKELPVVPTKPVNPNNEPVDPTDPTTPNKPRDPETTVTPKPTDPVPNDPKGRTYGELGLVEQVTRTIDYVYDNGTKVEEDKLGTAKDERTKTLTFTRNAKINAVTGEVTYLDANGNATTKELAPWTPATTDTFNTVNSPVIDTYVLLDSNQKTITGERVAATDNDIAHKVVYKKAGSIKPQIPAGVTPLTPATDTPYPNNPQDPSGVLKPDPTKPTDPTQPNGPTTPVIPEVTGYTPYGPNGKPLEKDPNGGYKVPDLPTDPTQDTPIVYVKNGEQLAITKFVDVNGNGLAPSVVDSGDEGTNFTKDGDVTATINAILARGYEKVANVNATEKEYPTEATDKVFDKDASTNQEFTVTFKPIVKEVPVDPATPGTKPQPGQPVDPGNPDGPKWPNSVKDLKNTDTVKRTIKYVYEDGTPVIDPATGAQKVVEQTAEFTRTANVNLVTGDITYGDWTPAKELAAVASPTATDIPAVANYIVSTATVPAVTVAAEADDITETVVYRQAKPVTITPDAKVPDPEDPNTPADNPIQPNKPIDPNNPEGPKWTKELIDKLRAAREETVTRTITYKYSTETSELKAEDAAKAGQTAADTVTNSVTFKRPVTIDPVTKEFTYGDWVADNNDTTLEGKADLPVVAGYVATGDVEASKKDVTDVKATDKDITENVVYKTVGKYVPVIPDGITPPANTNVDPKPYNNDPQDGSKVKDPDPTNPVVPGTTTPIVPQIPGTTPVGPDGKPLKPVDSNDLSKGYVPPTPTDPTKDTSIIYVKDGSQVAVVHFVDEKGNSVNESVVETGDTGNTISTTKADAVKTALEAKGYEVVAPTDALYTADKEGFYKEADRKFDAVSDKATGAADEKIPSQQYYVIVKAKDLPVDPTKPVDPNNNPVDPTNPTPENPTKPRDPETPVTPKPEDKVPNDPKGRTYGELGLVEQVTRTINYVKNDGSKAAEPVKETLTFTRKAKINAVTGEVTYLAADGVTASTKEDAPWTPVNGDKFTEKVSPAVPNYTPTVEKVAEKTGVTATDEDIVETVVYNPTKQTVDPNAPKDPSTPNVTPKPNDVVPNDPKGRTYKELGLIEEVTRTVHYVYEDGTKAADDKVQTITFTRTAEIDTVTGAISNFGTWTLKDENNTFEPETTEAKAGYVASAAKSTEVTGVQATDKDTEETIIYRKLGSYVPVVPAGVTPPADFDKTPKPYPNATPEDPTRPGTPTTPTTTIPEIPGTTPVGPDGTPLTKNPNGGYDLPPVPTDPTQNTTITYVKDGSQVAVVHFVDEKGNSVNESVVETGDTGKEISKSNVDAVKAKLEAKGYTVVEPTDALYTTDKEGFYKEATRTFDAVSDKSTGAAGEKVPSQQYYVIVKAKDLPVDPTKPLDPNNNPVDPTNPTPENPTKPRDPETPVTPKPEDKVPNDPKGRTYGELGLVEQVTRTINYVKNDGSKAAEPVKETLTFTRKAKINAVTGEVTYLDNDGNATTKEAAPWTPVNNDTTFDKVTSPSVPDYTPTRAEVPAKENVTATDEDIVETVVYNPAKVTVTPNDPNVDPEKPLNPNDPNGLKYKDLKLTEEVKRTITYTYADDVADTSKRGTDAAPKHETTVSFTRTATVNQATGEVTYGDWTAVNNDTTLEGKTELPVIPGYVATGDVESVKKDVANVSATDKDIVEKVVYKDLGKYVPVVPDGTTPPTITDPKYPNNPTDPTKPGEPTTTIPNVPGLTPLDPSTGKPLEPKDPNDLTKGYKPPVPQDPSKDTNIVYVADGSQVTVVHFVDEDGNAVHTSFVEAGDAGAKFTKAGEVTKVVEELKAAGYAVVPNKAGQAEYPGEAGVFDSVDDKGKDGVSQVYYVTVAKTVPVTPTNPENPNEDPKNPKPGDPINPNKPDGPKWTEDALNKLNNIKSVTRTITYVKDGTDEEVSTTEAPKVTNKVSFTRTAIVNPKDGSVVGYDTNGDGKVDVPATDTTTGWTAAGTAKFAEVKSPVVKGYVVKPNQDTQGDLVEADGSKVKASTTDLTVDSPNQDLKVRYVPVGTWTPKVPDGETPIDPIPYPNDPKDPGKVVDPNKPTDPNDPNKPSVPVVPHIPGTTPKDPNGNPLKPVDPEDPSKGYVPPTPTTPTENTVIEYVKDDQKAVTKFVDPSGNPIPGVNNIEEKGKSGEPLTKATEVANEIAKLIAKGYELVSNNYGKDNNGNFDKDSGKDQEYTVVLTPHVEPIKPFDPTNPNDPNKPKPGTPIYPNNPDGPKWTEELIKSLETTKHVTRTISYVDKDGNKVEYTDKDGNKSTADVTDKVTFTREAKINLVTGAIEYGKWTPVNNDTTFDKVTSPVVPGYVLKDPAQKEVAETTGLTENSKDENIKVVYVPVGRLVPKVPNGVTPPTPTPYDNDPQDPGKVVPPSPTKPQEPQDPNSPKVPVIPHIPGTTPKVPQDPTKPVDPNTNPLVPLKPVDPKDPSKGYEVPPVPTNPGTDTPIVYENDKQKAITNFVDNNGKVVSDPVVDQGDSGSKFTKNGEVEDKIKELLKKGYIVTSNDYPSADTDRVFDNDKDKDQIFNVKVTPLIVPTDPNSPDKPQVPTDPTKPVGPNNPLKPVTPSNPEPGKPVFPEDPNSPVWPETVKDLVTESSATRTITYVDRNGKEVAATHTETIKFKRTAKVNLVTGDITYGEWTVVGDDTILNGNPLPSVKGYIARGGDIKESQEDIKAEAGKNITQTVVYAKLGSWIPRLPEGQTNVPPTPYPNDPTDPTKPGTDKPKVPYVPGFIPVDPNGNPLKPVDPNDPTKGYEVPDVPADPTQDTPIKYIPVPTPNNGGGNNGGGGGNIPTPQPQPNPTPQPEPNPAPVPVTPETPEQPVAPVTPEQPAEPATPQYMDGQRELPNTGTEAHSSLAALGLLGALSGFGLIARKKRKDEE